MIAKMVVFGMLLSVAPIQAQERKHAFVIVDITSIDDPEMFKTLLPMAENAVSETHGKFLMRTNRIILSDGQPPERFVVIDFQDLADAIDLETSDQWKKVTEIRLKSTHSRQFIIESGDK